MSHGELEQSLSMLEKEWDVDPILKDLILGKISDVIDYTYKTTKVTFHIPYIKSHDRYVLWKCYWPDCHNCCERQGRLPLTSDDLITIGTGLGYSRVSNFIKNETLTATWTESGVTMTGVNLKRKSDETEDDDGTRISCRFLDDGGACGLHPGRPGVCHLYPFSTWLENEGGRSKVHAAYQFTGDCPGFYLAPDTSPMESTFTEYSNTIYDYNMKYARTLRRGLGAVSF